MIAHGEHTTERVTSVARIGALAVLLWAVGQQLASAPAHRPLGISLAVLAGAAWLGWLGARRLGAPGLATLNCLAVMSTAGGALSAVAPVAICFVAVAALGAAVALELRRGTVVAALGVAAIGIATSSLCGAHGSELLVEGAVSAAAGLFAGTEPSPVCGPRRPGGGAPRRASACRHGARPRGRTGGAAQTRTRAPRRPCALARRALRAARGGRRAAQRWPGLGRPSARPAGAGARDRRTRRGEERGARLAGEPTSLVEQLTSLATKGDVALSVAGEPKRLGDEAELALYRSAQEALSNARKHAPGAPVTMCVDFSGSRTRLVIVSGSGETGSQLDSALRTSGGGFGLRGMRERVEHVGGTCRSGPADAGWEVCVEVPT